MNEGLGGGNGLAGLRTPQNRLDLLRELSFAIDCPDCGDLLFRRGDEMDFWCLVCGVVW